MTDLTMTDLSYLDPPWTDLSLWKGKLLQSSQNGPAWGGSARDAFPLSGYWVASGLTRYPSLDTKVSTRYARNGSGLTTLGS